MDDLLDRVAAQAVEIARLRAELAQRREQYRAVIDHNPHPTWVYSLGSLRFLDVNDVAVTTYGWARDELLAMTIADIRPRDDVPELLANVARLRGQAGGVTGPWRHRRKDGSLVYVDITFLSIPVLGDTARLVVAIEASPWARPHAHAGLSALSPRERQVFDLVAHGRTSHEIGEQLGLSPKSVDTYRARFMAKLGLRTRADLVAFAIAHGALVG